MNDWGEGTNVLGEHKKRASICLQAGFASRGELRRAGTWSIRSLIL